MMYLIQLATAAQSSIIFILLSPSYHEGPKVQNIMEWGKVFFSNRILEK